jgi:hypothetical protein
MSRPGWLDMRAIIAGLAVLAGGAACGAAVDVRDKQAATTARLDKYEEVQAVRDEHIIYRLDSIDRKLGDRP